MFYINGARQAFGPSRALPVNGSSHCDWIGLLLLCGITCPNVKP